MNIYSVSEITGYIKNIVQNDDLLSRVYVRGEISNFKSHYSGHCYFTLKDSGAVIKSVMFKSKASLLKFAPENGMKVVACGTVSVFERDGQYQLYVQALLPEGVGERSIALAQLKERLEREGLFDQSYKRDLPKFSRVVGVVTSATGAVLRDIYTVSKRRNPNVRLCLYPVQVQGADAAGQIAAAIDFFNSSYPVDALIVGRGGGSMEDLWAFNEEIVVRAVYRSTIPVISAVGHDTDYTLTDFVADVRAATPSQAAEILVPDVREIARYVSSLQARIETYAKNGISNKRRQLAQCQKNKLLQNPRLILDEKRQIVDFLWEKLSAQKESFLREDKHKLMLLVEKLAVLDPLKVVQRGYGLVKKEDDIVSSTGQLTINDKFEVVLADGVVSAVVTKVRKEQTEDVWFGTRK